MKTNNQMWRDKRPLPMDWDQILEEQLEQRRLTILPMSRQSQTFEMMESESETKKGQPEPAYNLK